MRKFWFAQYLVGSSLAVLLLNGCGNVAAHNLESHWDCEMVGTNPCPAPKWQIDVRPKEWDGPEKVRDTEKWKDLCATFSRDGDMPKTDAICGRLVHHRDCVDESRFKLMSEDGKWHCLKLTP